MNKYFIAILSAVMFVAVGNAAKAEGITDFYAPAESAKGGVKDVWTGLYVGAGAGLKSQELDAGGFVTLGETSWAGDIRVGYDYMFAPHWVFGVFGQIGMDNIDYKLGGTKFADTDIAYQLGGRLGFVPRSDYMIYGLVAYEWSKVDFIGGIADVGGSSWVLGAGLEVALTDHLFLGAEGTVNLGSDDTINVFGPVNVEASDYTGKLRLSYKF